MNGAQEGSTFGSHLAQFDAAISYRKSRCHRRAGTKGPVNRYAFELNYGIRDIIHSCFDHMADVRCQLALPDSRKLGE